MSNESAQVGARGAAAWVAAAVALLALACASNPDGCPRAGLDSARRCKRLCVVGPGQIGTPLSCTCIAECLCWQMPGHVARQDPPELE